MACLRFIPTIAESSKPVLAFQFYYEMAMTESPPPFIQWGENARRFASVLANVQYFVEFPFLPVHHESWKRLLK